MAKAEQTFVDPSVLTVLYLHEQRSADFSKWRAKNRGPLLVTHHGRTEVINVICLASFYGGLSEGDRRKALSQLATDFASGELQHADVLWRAALNRAAELSELHTPKLGTRSLAVLHIACALELRLPYFLTFDLRQEKLAQAAGLKIVRL